MALSLLSVPRCCCLTSSRARCARQLPFSSIPINTPASPLLLQHSPNTRSHCRRLPFRLHHTVRILHRHDYCSCATFGQLSPGTSPAAHWALRPSVQQPVSRLHHYFITTSSPSSANTLSSQQPPDPPQHPQTHHRRKIPWLRSAESWLLSVTALVERLVCSCT